MDLPLWPGSSSSELPQPSSLAGLCRACLVSSQLGKKHGYDTGLGNHLQPKINPVL